MMVSASEPPCTEAAAGGDGGGGAVLFRLREARSRLDNGSGHVLNRVKFLVRSTASQPWSTVWFE
ncbi:hypothetical protein HanIR_Chr17g0879701 [Helianthus annuus]|nr:hypothetical protein HanIR_Chr17g0879701 [Helianthus annuus]